MNLMRCFCDGKTMHAIFGMVRNVQMINVGNFFYNSKTEPV